MEDAPVLSRIWIYPIKSLDGVSVESATITAGGSLTMDREFALVDKAGKVVNAKRTAKIHQVRSQFDLPQRLVMLSSPDQQSQTFSLDRDRASIAVWLSDFFGFEIRLVQNQITGFPDDLQASGPTIISEATLATTAGWFEGITTDDMRSRLRTNLEVTGVPAFWEDCLFSEPLIQQDFQIDKVIMRGTNPCQRCVVPMRDQKTGELWPRFKNVIAESRQTSLPDWSDKDMFNHYYRLAVNTKIEANEQGKRLTVGASVRV